MMIPLAEFDMLIKFAVVYSYRHFYVMLLYIMVYCWPSCSNIYLMKILLPDF